MMKKMLAMLLALAMALCAGCAMAERGTADVLYIERSWNGSAVAEEEKTLEASSYKVVESYTESSWDGSRNWKEEKYAWYVVSGTVTISQRLIVEGTVHLVLCDDAVLTAEKGITVEDENELIIHGQRGGTGKLIARTNNHYAGIGGISGIAIGFGSPHGGKVTIHGGKVEATGGDYGAGIGGGNGGTCGTVTIYGGSVKATGGSYGAGIGGGYGTSYGSGSGGSGSTVTIYGGEVEATGGSYGAGIGGGYGMIMDGLVSIPVGIGGVTIEGGTVIARGGKNGAGIGGGRGGTCGTVTINGGEVEATGGEWAAGIGGGYGGNGSAVTIGGGYSGTVTINGGTVIATGGENGAGIGGGSRMDHPVTDPISGTIITYTGGDGGTVIITGGCVKAEGKGGSADIGRGTGGASNGSVKDGNGHDVSLKRITLSGAADGTAVTAADGLTGYGLEDVETIGESLYFYLPENAQANAITANGTTYQHAGGNIFRPEETTDDPDDSDDPDDPDDSDNPDGMPMYPNMTDYENGYRNEDGRDLPETGDASMLGAWAALLGASAMGLGKMKKKS